MRKAWSLLLVLCLLPLCALGEDAALPAQTAGSNLAAIRINEFMASNGETLQDARGESSDWIELYNTSDQDVNLAGLCLSDGKKTLDKFVFPSYVLPAHGYLIVFASGLDTETKGEIHLPFKLSADGERVVLSYLGVILDIVSFDAQTKDVSMARYDDRSWRFTGIPTPGAENQFSPES